MSANYADYSQYGSELAVKVMQNEYERHKPGREIQGRGRLLCPHCHKPLGTRLMERRKPVKATA